MSDYLYGVMGKIMRRIDATFAKFCLSDFIWRGDSNTDPIHRSLFKTMGIPHTTGQDMLENGSERRLHNDISKAETRWWKKKLSTGDLHAVELLL